MKISVIGIGNILRGDDGIGVRIAEYMKKYSSQADIYEGEQNIDLCVQIIEESDYVYIIDCTKIGGPPGSIYIFDIESILKTNTVTASFHECNLLSFLKIMFNSKPVNVQGKLIGVEPESIGFSTELSEILKSKIPVAGEIIKNDIRIIKGIYKE